ncbi:50S ribosomal protein L32 [Bailinhaonella thermotolerans]|uniref:Large ribosomal subunit protein bL32 n=1 Tax=Bailinhaonella thermotolerans TaxID=1070861 RepID=A0A3A4AMP0_9ACTN|nr:50S ribosomal protein L32 [Bailinhaonella thermotolerans]RJL27083.1 50S ribosomal protein L32 [Bailinhaonella thermotolerans]
MASSGFRKKSRANVRARRSRWKAKAPTLTACRNPGCGAPTPPHTACPACGTYRGRQVIRPS